LQPFGALDGLLALLAFLLDLFAVPEGRFFLRLAGRVGRLRGLWSRRRVNRVGLGSVGFYSRRRLRGASLTEDVGQGRGLGRLARILGVHLRENAASRRGLGTDRPGRITPPSAGIAVARRARRPLRLARPS